MERMGLMKGIGMMMVCLAEDECSEPELHSLNPKPLSRTIPLS